MPLAPGITPATMPGAPPIPPKPRAAPEPEPEPEPEVERVQVIGPAPLVYNGADWVPIEPVAPPSPPQQPRPPQVALSREQHMRRIALELAVKHHADLECTPDEVLGVAKAWAIWIRTGTSAP